MENLLNCAGRKFRAKRYGKEINGVIVKLSSGDIAIEFNGMRHLIKNNDDLLILNMTDFELLPEENVKESTETEKVNDDLKGEIYKLYEEMFELKHEIELLKQSKEIELLDEMAGKVLNGFLSKTHSNIVIFEFAVEKSYKIAEMMLEERKKYIPKTN